MKKFRRFLARLKRGLMGIQESLFDRPSLLFHFPKEVIGSTVQGKSINCYVLGEGSRKVLFFAGIHGNEVGTVKLMCHFLSWISKQPSLLKIFQFFIIPCLNLDGYEIACKRPDYFGGGRHGRFNAHQVDLNRNFDTPSFCKQSRWLFGKNYSESVEVFCGEKPNSEPEVKALTDFIHRKHIKIVFGFHNAGRDVGSTCDEIAQQLKEVFAQKSGFRAFTEDEWQRLGQTGTAKEWAEHHHVSYLEIEGSTRWGSDWNQQKVALKACLQYLVAYKQ